MTNVGQEKPPGGGIGQCFGRSIVKYHITVLCWHESNQLGNTFTHLHFKKIQIVFYN